MPIASYENLSNRVNLMRLCALKHNFLWSIFDRYRWSVFNRRQQVALLDEINSSQTINSQHEDRVGRGYEYFLGKFGWQTVGEFDMPKSNVNLIAEMIVTKAKSMTLVAARAECLNLSQN